MNVFFSNYWSLWLDFIGKFHTLRHRQIPFALLAKMQHYIDHPDIMKLLNTAGFARRHTSRVIAKDAEVQPGFERYMPAWKQPRHTPDGQSKVIFYNHQLMLPLQFYDGYLPQGDAMFIAAGPPQPASKDARIQYLERYAGASADLVRVYRGEAGELLRKHADHPVYGHPFFRSKLLSDIEPFVRMINATKHVMDHHRVRAIVLGMTNDLPSRLMALHARIRAIPCIAAQHGILGREWGFLPVYVTNLAVYGQYEKRWYRGKGVSRQAVTVTGHPRYDTIYTDPPAARASVLAKHKLHPGNRHVLIATNGIRDLQAWQRYVEALMAYPNVVVVLKPHRSEFEDLTAYRELCAKYSRVRLIVSRKRRIYDLLRAMDVVAIELSTVGLESMLCRVPTVCLRKKDYKELNHQYYFAELGEFAHPDPVRLAKLTYRIIADAHVRALNTAAINRFLSAAYPVVLSGKSLSDMLGKLTGKSWRNPIAARYEKRLVIDGRRHMYWIRDGHKRRFASKKVFLRRGHLPAHVRRIPEEDLIRIPSGPLIRK